MQRILIIILAVSLFSCTSKDQKKSTDSISNVASEQLPDWARSANIYEVNIRQYTEEGTINAFAEHLPRLKKMGVDILWLMPIYPISDSKKKGTLGSYYAVSNFMEVNPEFGTMADVDQLIEKIHELDMKIILDWVPNHTGWDHVWIKEHPDWYSQDEKGNIIDPQNDQGESFGWTDVADLNYDSQNMRTEMIRQLEWWIQEKDIDGYRMDIAFGVPDDFWKSVKEKLYSIKPIFMLAESENHSHRNEGYFHSTYAWNLFHCMNDIAKSEKKVANFIEIHQQNKESFKAGNSLHFTSNHDENSWNGTVFERLGDGAQGWAVIMTLLDGIPLVYSGMEEPLNKRLAFFEKDTINFDKFAYEDFYTSLFELKKKYSALHNLPYGSEVEWIPTNSNILAFQRKSKTHTISVFFNTSNSDQTINQQGVPGKILLSNQGIHRRDKELLKAYEFIVLVD